MRVVVRIRTGKEKRIRPEGRANRRMAHLGAAVLLPLALFCFFVCAWRWSYDLSLTGHYPIAEGLLSRWQVWFFTGSVLQVVAVLLARYAESLRREPSLPTPAADDSRQAQIP